MTQDKDRAAFEAFMSDGGKFPLAIERDQNGDYVLAQSASSWYVWQQAIAHDRQQRGEVVVTWDESGTRILAVTRQDIDGKILSVIAETPAQQRGEPVYLFRRKGQDDFVTCSRDRFDELSAKPNLFEVRILYTAPQPAEPVKVPSDADIEAIALESGICKSSEHWGDRYYTELGRNLFTFARALLARYGSAEKPAVLMDTDPESAYLDHEANACPYCGGSGHKDDAQPDPDAARWRKATTLPRSWWCDALAKMNAGSTLDQLIDEHKERRLP